MWIIVGTTLLVAGLLSGILTPWMARVALARGVMDRPSPRKVHHRPVPRLGGVAVFLGWLAAVGVAGVLGMTPDANFLSRATPLLLLGAGAMLFGLWDDATGLSGRRKLLMQMLLGTLVAVSGLRIDRLSNPLGGELLLPWALSVGMTILWVVGMMNAMNLIDGLDGLATGVAMIAALGLVMVGLLTGRETSVVIFAALAGSCAGFLLYNFPPARIFLGDAGSQFLGFMFAAASLIDDQYKAATAATLLVPLTTLALPVFDVALAILRRLRGRHSVFQADKHHLHHRLLKMGLSQRRVVLFCYLISVYFGCLAFLFVLIPSQYAMMLLVVILLGLLMAIQTLRFIELKLRQFYRRTRRPTARASA